MHKEFLIKFFTVFWLKVLPVKIREKLQNLNLFAEKIFLQQQFAATFELFSVC